ncbi:MAG: diacylglycerol kinase family protein [Erysipelotrichaceae bacterium]|nr:diacylglycerol kinase family protein [Erysipelotrichaceae bacterium]
MKKFLPAFHGLKLAIKDKGIRIQFILAVMAIIGGFIIRLDRYEWLAFTICIAMVISSEIFNSAIEKLCNRVNEAEDERIKVIKDLSCTAVFMACAGSLIVCVICVLRRLQ